MTQLFAEPSAQPAQASSAGLQKEPIIAALAEAKQAAVTQRDDWAGRRYAPNSAQVELRGDGPSKQGMMSIGSINEGRRSKAVEALNQEIAAIEGIERALADDAGAARLTGLIERVRANAAHDAARDGRPEQAGDYFERGILDALGIRPAQGAYASNAVSKALRKALEATPGTAAISQAVPRGSAGKPARRTREQAAAARKRAYRDANPFRAFLGEFGVHTSERSDAGGDPRRPVMIPYHGAMFRNSGMHLDGLARRAVEAGFLTQADIDSEFDNGGVNKLADMIRRELAGERIMPIAQAEDTEEARWREQSESYWEAMNEAEDAVAALTDDEINALLQIASDEDAEVSNEEIDIALESGDAQESGAGAQEGAAGPETGGDSAGGAAARDQGSAEVGFDLTAPTPDQFRREAADAEAQARREGAPPPEDFTLTGSNRTVDQTAARGQMELAPAPDTGSGDATAPSAPTGGSTGKFDRIAVPHDTVRWMGFSGARSVRADLEALYRRHPEYYESPADVQRDIEFVLGRPDGWYIHNGARVVLFRERAGTGAIPQTRVEVEADAADMTVRSVYVGNRRQIAKKMADKRGELKSLGLGGQSPDSLTIAEYLAALGDGSSRPAPPSGGAPEADPNVAQSEGSGKSLVARANAALKAKIEDVGEKIGGARKDLSTPTGRRAAKAEDEAPGWRKRYEVSQITKSTTAAEEGRWAVYDKRQKDWLGQPKQVGRDTFPTKEAAEAAIPLAEVARNHRVTLASTTKGAPDAYEITRMVTDRKRVKVVNLQFATREDATRYMVEHAVEIIETKTSFGEEILPAPDTVRREGPLRRGTLVQSLVDRAHRDAKIVGDSLVAHALSTQGHGSFDVPLESVFARSPDGVDAVLQQSNSYVGAASAELLGNLDDAGTLSVENFRRLDVPSKRVVLTAVLALGHDPQIRSAVVELVPVDVVNLLGREKLSAEHLLRDETVLGNLLAVDSDPSVAAPDAGALKLARAIAGMRAERGLRNAIRASLERDSAESADSRDLSQFGTLKEDVTGEDLRRTFSFKGIEFGNWNSQEERQEVMNHAFDGLADLAEVLGIPTRAIGLNGELALAFGARGSGLTGARAHYEPDYSVINLTKMRGAGSLAHEWLHALDHYLGRQDGKASSERVKNNRSDTVFKTHSPEGDMASHGFKYRDSGVRPEVREAYAALIETMYRKAEQYVEDTQTADRFVGKAREDVQKHLGRIRENLATKITYRTRKNAPASAEQLAAFDEIARKIVDGEAIETTVMPAGKSGVRWSNDALEALSRIIKDVRGHSGFLATRDGTLDRLRAEMEHYSQRLKMLAQAQSAEVKTKKVPTDYAMAAKSIDQGRASDYWSTQHEMAARAFQSYVLDKIAERGNTSDFLTYGAENLVVPTPWGWQRPFPAGDERKAINAAFDKLVATLQTRETDKGVALFSRTGTGPGLSHAQAADAVDALLKPFEHAVPTRILESATGEIPGTVPDDHVSGAVHRGRVHLFLDELADGPALVRTLWHELLHYGLRRFLSRDEYIARMGELYGDDAWVRDRADDWMRSEQGRGVLRDHGMDYARARGVDEALGDLAETLGGAQDPRGALRRTLDAVTEWLARLADVFGFDAASTWLRTAPRQATARYVRSVFERLRDDAAATSSDWAFTADPAFASAPREVTYTITKVGRKWLEGKQSGKPYTNQIEINDASSGWKIGDTVTFMARTEFTSGRYGTTVQVFPMTAEAVASERAATENARNLAEIRRQLDFIEDSASRGQRYANGVDKVMALGIAAFPAEKARLDDALAKVRTASAAPRTYLRVAYAEKAQAKAHGARWDAERRQWYVHGAVPKALERFLPEQAGARPADAPRDRPATDTDRETLRIDRGSGYGGRPFSVGQVLRNPGHARNSAEPEFVTVLSASQRYFREDGLSFGVGDDQGYIYSATVRPATEAETALLIEREQAAEQRRATLRAVDELRTTFIRDGERPNPAEPAGEVLLNTFTIYGGGERWHIDREGGSIWYVRNNGADGDNWTANNVRTGGAGAIGWRMPWSAQAEHVLRDAALLKPGQTASRVLFSRSDQTRRRVARPEVTGQPVVGTRDDIRSWVRKTAEMLRAYADALTGPENPNSPGKVIHSGSCSRTIFILPHRPRRGQGIDSLKRSSAVRGFHPSL